MTLNDWTRKKLLALPTRTWGEESNYDSLLLLSTRTKHDSGWAVMAIIGVREFVPVEIACQCCDDIEWMFHPATMCGSGDNAFAIGQIHMDCTFPAGALHAWNNSVVFRVGLALSSVKITVMRSKP